jgi:integrase
MSNKRPNGEGSFFFDEKKQLYRGMVTTPAGRRLTKASKSEEVVKDWLNEQRLLVGRNQHIEPTGITLGQWLQLWLNNYNKQSVRQRSYESNESSIEHFDTIGNIQLSKLTPLNIQSLYNDLREEGYAASSIQKYHSVLVSALKQAIINKHLNTNVAQLVKPPKIVKEEIEIFTESEIDLLLTTAKDNRYYPALLLAITTGMRRGEVLGIRWRDIDLDNKSLFVRQNLQSTQKKGIIFEPPKTEAGKRKIPLPEKTVKALTEYKKVWNESYLKHKKKEDVKKRENSDLVFVTGLHTPITPRNFTDRFWEHLQMFVEFDINNFVAKPMSEKKKYKVILEECRKREDWKIFNSKNFHALRHTYATTLLASGVPVTDVSKVLGHAKVSTTYDIYSHAMPKNLNMIADKIALAFLK